MAQWLNPHIMILTRLGGGGMAEVFHGLQVEAHGFQRPVAIKKILAGLADRENLRIQFAYEARLYAKLRHQNIVQVYSAGESNDQPYLVMEYVSGKTLYQVLRKLAKTRSQVPLAFACFMAREVALALEYAHNLCDESGRALNLVHRDVTPQNIMVSYSGEIKVLDFGIAKTIEQVQLTKTGDVKGKVGYMSPEYLENGQVDGRMDIYSLGVVLWETLALRSLFPGDSPIEIMQQTLTKEAPALNNIRGDIPDELESIVEKALCRDLSRRYAHARDFAQALTTFLSTNAPGYISSNAGE
jgi:serine/threonine-protein kinase